MKNLDYRTKLIAILLYSAVLIGKAYAFFGLALGAVLIFEGKMFWRRWFNALTQRGHPAGAFSWALLVSLLYGIAQVIRAWIVEEPIGTALEILVFNLCPIYFWWGLWAGARAPGMVRKYIRFVAWYTVIYTVLFFAFFQGKSISLSGILPGSNIDLLGAPGSGSSTLLGLLAYETHLGQWWLPIIVLCCLTIANQERADWLGLIVAVTLWGFLTRRIGRVMMVGAVIASLLLVAYLVDLRLPAIEGRGGVLSARDTVARMAASISPDLAQDVGSTVSNSQFYYGTVLWRKNWWAHISEEVSGSPLTIAFGLGYGYPLAELAGHEVMATGTRSPHNIFFFAYGYSGLVGVAIFFWLQISLLVLLWRAFKVSGETYALTLFAYELLGAFFGNFLETPQGGIYIYVILGLIVGPALSQMEFDREPVPMEYSVNTSLLGSERL